MLKRNKSPKAFTLVEMLVVIGVIAILIGLLFPALLRVNRVAKKTESMSRMRQISMWMGEYSSDNGDIILPSQFDYSDSSITPYPGKVRSIPQSSSGLTLSVGLEHQGTWTDILWTINNLWSINNFGSRDESAGSTKTVEEDLTYSFRYDSPTRELYDYLDNDLTNPLRAAAFNSKQALEGGTLTPFGNGADALNIPGFFAANDFFDARPDAPPIPGAAVTPEIGNWLTNGQIRVPDRSMYLVDSFYGEIIEPDADAYGILVSSGSGEGPTKSTLDPDNIGEVDFRYSGTCLMLFLDGHIENVGPWPGLSFLQNSLRINITNPLSSTP